MQVGHDSDYVRNKIRRLCPSTVALYMKIKPWTWLREKTGALIKKSDISKSESDLIEFLPMTRFHVFHQFCFDIPSRRSQNPPGREAAEARLSPKFAQAGPAGCQQAQSAAHRHTPMQWH